MCRSVCVGVYFVDVTFFIFFLTSCKGHTEACNRLVIGKLPATICLQLSRFSSNGKKFQHIVKYDEMLKLCEMHISDDSGSTEITRVSYKLVAVVVHIGNKLSSGHYVCYMKRNGLWYNADDEHVKECTPFEATNQQAYLLFFERDVSDDPVVKMTQGLSFFSTYLRETSSFNFRQEGNNSCQKSHSPFLLCPGAVV